MVVEGQWSPEECPAGVAGDGPVVEAGPGGGPAHRAHHHPLLTLHPTNTTTLQNDTLQRGRNGICHSKFKRAYHIGPNTMAGKFTQYSTSGFPQRIKVKI